MKPTEICCHRPEARLVDDCSGGNSRPLHPSGVGGGHFLIKKSDNGRKAAGWDRTVTRFLKLIDLRSAPCLWASWLMAGARRLVGWAEKRNTAFGVFFRFQVTDFDRRFGFFSLCHFIFS